MTLPSFVRSTLSRRSDTRMILVGNHESDACLVSYDRAFARVLASDCRRRRIAEEASRPEAHHARDRRVFGLVEELRLEARGRIVLPPMMRRRAGIWQAALLIGLGGTFEIWNPQRAVESDDPDLRELAAFHLESQLAA